MNRSLLRISVVPLTCAAALGIAALAGCGGNSGSSSNGLPAGAPTRAQVLQGRYLVTSLGCMDCHNRGTDNPADPNWLAGYIPNPPAEQGKFNVGGFNTYAANLTPDKTTGLGNWTPQNIFDAVRTGKDKNGEYLCPPMPWPSFRNLTDADLWSIVAYLRNVKPVANVVPESQGPNPHENGHGDWSSAYTGLQPLPSYPAGNETNVP